MVGALKELGKATGIANKTVVCLLVVSGPISPASVLVIALNHSPCGQPKRSPFSYPHPYYHPGKFHSLPVSLDDQSCLHDCCLALAITVLTILLQESSIVYEHTLLIRALYASTRPSGCWRPGYHWVVLPALLSGCSFYYDSVAH